MAGKAFFQIARNAGLVAGLPEPRTLRRAIRMALSGTGGASRLPLPVAALRRTPRKVVIGELASLRSIARIPVHPAKSMAISSRSIHPCRWASRLK
jgi:hypothetical protein